MIELKKIRPMFTGIVTTANKWEERDFEPKELVYKSLGQLKDYQTVLSVGSSVREVKEGDVVMVSFERFAVKKYPTSSIKSEMDIQKTVSYDIPGYVVDGKEVLLLDERDVVMVLEEYEEKKAEWSDEALAGIKASKSGIYTPVSSTLDAPADIVWDLKDSDLCS